MEVINRALQNSVHTIFKFLNPRNNLNLNIPANDEPQERPGRELHNIVVAEINNHFNWAVLVIGFCLTAAVDVALLSMQLHIQIPPTLHLLCLALVLAFASMFVSKCISPKFPVLSKVLEKAGILFTATAFFLAVTFAFPLCLKLVSWAIYALSLLAIFVSSRL